MSDAELPVDEAEEMYLVTTRSPRDAPLPVSYEAARAALQQCQAVDECSTWAKKAAALASYARQADDDSLEKMAMKIRGRAVRRCGELLKMLPAKAYGGGSNKQGGDPAPHLASERAKAATEAGMSRDQVKQAIRVANVPAKKFEAAIEADKPATVKTLEKMGTAKKESILPPDYLEGRDPAAFNRSMRLAATAAHFAKELKALPVPDFVEGATKDILQDVEEDARVIETWLKEFRRKS